MTKTLWAGKVLGGAAGVITGGLAGLVIGAYAGHIVDKLLLHWLGVNGLTGESDSVSGRTTAANTRAGAAQKKTSAQNVQEVFFNVSFRSMGSIAKSDGRVSEAEINAASQIMQRMGLSSSLRQRAIQLFNEGKVSTYNAAQDWANLRQSCEKRHDLIQMFVEIQLSVGYADGQLSQSERQLFKKMTHQLGMNAFQFEWINNRVRSSIQGQRRQSQQRRSSASAFSNELDTAYGVLGVAADINDRDLKKTYRKLMNEHHPDKLIARGLPDSMMKLAKEKTQEIQQAYDVITKHRRQA